MMHNNETDENRVQDADSESRSALRSRSWIPYLLLGMLLLTLIGNVIAYFFLPEQIATSITFDGSAPRKMSTLLYLIVSFVLTGLACLGGLYYRGSTKYLIIASVLFLANLAAILLNGLNVI